MSQMARSHDLPASSVPTSLEPAQRARRLARHAGEASRRRSGGTASRAMFMASSSEVSGEVPGLQSVAMRHRHAVLAEELDRRLLRLAQEVEGARQQHRDRAGLAPSPRRRPRRCIPGDRPTARRSARPARRRRRLESWSACSFTGRPRRCAASNTRAVCSGVKAMPSQKASTASASPAFATAGSIVARRPARCRRPCRRRPRAAARARRGRSWRPTPAAPRPAGARRAADVISRVEVEAVAGLDLDAW